MLKRRIKSITIKNYRSITDLTVELEDLTVLVGANGSGKSNFVDVLRFLNLCMFSLDNALFNRGGINRLVNRVRTNDDMSIEIVCEIDQTEYTYGFIIGKQNENDYTFKKEFLKRNNEILLHYEDNQWRITPNNIPLAPPTIVLTLPSMRNYDGIAPVYDLLNDIVCLQSGFSLGIEELYQGHKFLRQTNLQSVLYEISQVAERKRLFEEYLATLAPFILSFKSHRDKSVITTKFEHQNGTIFDLPEESNGTLHILQLLTALLQPYTPSLLVIEEPENGIHPGALAMLCEIIEEASLRQQIIITTHSPDLITKFDVNAIRVVEMTDDGTKIDMLDDRLLEAVNQKLFSTSDILSMEGRLRRKQHDS